MWRWVSRCLCGDDPQSDEDRQEKALVERELREQVRRRDEEKARNRYRAFIPIFDDDFVPWQEAVCFSPRTNQKRYGPEFPRPFSDVRTVMATTLEEMSRSHFAHANLLMVDDPLRAPIVEGAMGRELMDRYLEREARARNYAQRF